MSASPRPALAELLGGDEDARACRDIDDAACREQPRNLRVHLLSLSLTKMGDGIADAKLLLSWLASALGAPSAAVAMLVPVREAFALLPQLAVAAAVRRMPVRKGVWLAGSLGQASALLGMALVAVTMHGAPAGWLLVALLALFSLARGVCSVASKDVLGKTVAKQRRGRLSGHAATVGGLAVLALGVSLLVVPIRDQGTGPLAWLLCAGASLWLLATLVYATLAEHPGATDGGANALQEAVAALGLLRRDRQLARFLVARALLTASALVAPFLVLLARDLGHGDLGGLALLLIASGAASLASGALWGRMADGSSRRVMVISGAMAGLAAIAAAALALGASRPWTGAALGCLYFVLCVAHTGVRLGRKTHLVDMAGADGRTRYVALSNTLIGAVLLVGGAFGVLAELVGVVGTVLVLGALALAGSIVSLGLDEVQHAS